MHTYVHIQTRGMHTDTEFVQGWTCTYLHCLCAHTQYW